MKLSDATKLATRIQLDDPLCKVVGFRKDVESGVFHAVQVQDLRAATAP